MSDFPPDKAAPQPGAVGSGAPAGAPSGTPHWATPAVPPAPNMDSARPTSSVEAASAPTAASAPAAAPTDVPPWGYAPAAATPPAAAPGPVGWPGALAQQPQGWPGAMPAARTFAFNRERWLPTAVVATIIAGVVLGGIGLDKVVAAPSAGMVVVGGSVTITAAPGWVLAPAQDATSSGVELQKSDAILTAQVVRSSFSGSSASMLSDEEQSLQGDTATVTYGSSNHTTISGHDTTYVAFNALVTSGQRSGIVDGELVCMVVNADAVVIVVGAPQGDLDPVIDDVTAMLESVGVGQ